MPRTWAGNNSWKDICFYSFVIVAIFLVAFAVRYEAYSIVGITVDEPVYVQAGISYVSNILNGDLVGNQTWRINLEHPPVAKYIYGAGTVLLNGGTYDYRANLIDKMISVLLGCLTCILTFLIGLRTLDWKVGAVGALTLALTPVFIAHTTLSTLDSPVTFMTTLTILVFVYAGYTTSIRNRQVLFALSAILTGLSLATKFTAPLILPAMLVLYICDKLYRKEKIDGKKMILYGAGFLLLAGMIFFLSWPYLWTNPVGNLEKSLSHWGYTPIGNFMGHMQKAPFYYYVVYFLVDTPIIMLALLLAAVAGMAVALRKTEGFDYRLLFLPAWLFIPFAYGFSNMVQGSMRYLLVIYPALGLMCGYGIFAIATAYANYTGATGETRERQNNVAFAALSLLVVGSLAYTCIEVQPLYLDYYNQLAGGTVGVYKSQEFLSVWWGEGMYTSVEYVEAHAHNRSVGISTFDIPPYRPGDYVSMYAKNNSYYLLPQTNYSDIAHAINASKYDYIIMNIKNDKAQSPCISGSIRNYTLVYQGVLEGHPIYNVYKNNMVKTNTTKSD